ncbi:MAG: PorP/SprF family type IX secretion system membrane protein [Phaeodactylibacter sp.]|nr:PorP/SprF family type IX secretion system membrane protein [Phaeodactylibacter sp.]
MTSRWTHQRAVAYVALTLLLLPFSGFSQDPSFSQFYANRIYLNPAFAGMEPGIGISGVARMQWARVDKGFRTYGFSADAQLPVARLGVGLHLLRDTEGIGNLTINQAGLVLSYTIPGPKDNIHFGMEGRLVQKSLDWSRLVFSDQLDPVYGVVSASSVTPALDRVFHGDFDFGIVWRHEGSLRMGGRSLHNVRSHLGLSFHHLPYLISRSARGNDSFLNLESRLAPRTTFHGGIIIPMTVLQGTGMDIAISPNFKFDMQGYRFMSFRENMTVGTVGLYGLVSNFYLGLLYQNRAYLPNALHTDAFILTIGGYTNPQGRGRQQQPSFFFGVSADINSTGLGPAAGSVFEFTFRYRFLPAASADGRLRGPNRRKNRFLDCRHFF